jgi:hypothetical protein
MNYESKIRLVIAGRGPGAVREESRKEWRTERCPRTGKKGEQDLPLSNVFMHSVAAC